MNGFRDADRITFEGGADEVAFQFDGREPQRVVREVSQRPSTARAVSKRHDCTPVQVSMPG
jgi:hypothetical protein